MDSVMNELVALRQQVGMLHEENRRLEAQLQTLQGAHVAATHGDEEPWIGARQDAFSRDDIQYIEREILCLKQKLSDTRQKLRVTADQPPPLQHQHQPQALLPEHEAAQAGAGPMLGRGAPLGSVSLNHDHDSFSFFPQPTRAAGVHRSKAGAKVGAASSKSAVPASTLRARAGTSSNATKKAPASGVKPRKENAGKTGLSAAHSKLQRKGS
ncbi:hypothetical protein HXX76_009934 [Chlamydomonas incerta]|uniref:Uncharacterized protein n=1 Tax=Chlamydomonas incerta TaxID=51695 RepID=A0A835VYL2_CHLIN|nr:hypothetical protein HXX76_009934 [Chlamydomonas incerta]|eukprot:KAG2430409.1 hypothetical protein HXX76_009934 [Chlamydomonas incerta]